jgi:hypothetical protein
MGKNLIMATFSNNSDGEKVGFLTLQSFFSMAAPEKISVGKGMKPMSEVWMANANRRVYFDIGIYHNDDATSGTLNIWNGWGCVPDPEASCEHYLHHVRDIICSGDEQLTEWLLDWMADAIQDSRDVKGTCVVLRGVEGCGKGVFADQFGHLFGKHYTHLIDAERLTTRFNMVTADSILVFADEVLWPGDRKVANVLKGMVSERRVVREAKGIDSIEVDNLSRIIISSNEDWIVPAGPGSRRWLVLNVSDKVAKNKVYFDRLFGEMEKQGGRSALLSFLLHRKITNNLRTAPTTKGLIEQRRLSNRHDSLLHFLSEAMVRGRFSSIDVDAKMGDADTWPTTLLAFELFTEYRDYCKDARVSTYDCLAMTVFMSKLPDYGFVHNGNKVTVPTISDLKLKMGGSA